MKSVNGGAEGGHPRAIALALANFVLLRFGRSAKSVTPDAGVDEH